MIIKVKFLPKGKDFKETKLKKGARGLDLLDKLNLAPDAHIISRKGEPIPLDDELIDGDSISIIKVVSGG
ncbi:MAG: MoaD/ThiS family protein [Thermoplasmata archaeon]|nr:MAG: MoaD/ThiS family protein [Thermoplasmata archaeon]